MDSKRTLLWLFVLGALVLSACNLPSGNADNATPDPNAVFTAAAQTASVQLTQAAGNANAQWQARCTGRDGGHHL